MAQHYRELLAAARLLLVRGPGQRGPLSSARTRRSISTAYYAIFHFAQEECALRIVGSGHRHLRRRRIFIRTLTHRGMKVALQKVAGILPAADIADFLIPAGGVAAVPPFASAFAQAFVEAQGQRHAADYDLNVQFNGLDAVRISDAVEAAIDGWVAARSDADRDLKHALCLLVMLQGRLRPDNG